MRPRFKLLNTLRFPFNIHHTYKALSKYLIFDDVDYDGVLLLDPEFDEHPRLREACRFEKFNGKKIVYLVYDPYTFPSADQYIAEKLLDQIILFDKQFFGRFTIPTLITDYIVNEDLFKDVVVNKTIHHFCYFGHVNAHRVLPLNTTHLHCGQDETGFKQLYQDVSNYKGSIVFGAGNKEMGTPGILYHNKAKIIECLLSGTQPYLMDKFETINYNQYLSYDLFQKPRGINKGEILTINDNNIRRICNSMIQ
jgi:hypothetical protein